MPYVAGQLVDQLLHRVRDPDAVGTSRTFCLLALTHLQRILNCQVGAVVDSLTLVTNPEQHIYRVSDLMQATNAMRIIGVQEGGRDLKRIVWQEFFFIERKWARAIGGRFDLWAMVGRDLLVVWPAKDAASSVTLVYAKLTETLVNDSDPIELPDDLVPLLLDLGEALVSLKKRTYLPVQKLQETLQKRLSMF